MSFITRIRKQQAVYWAKTGVDKYGKITYAAPIQVPVRWTDNTAQRVNALNVTYASRGVVFVDRDMNLGDRMQLGTLTGSTPADPMQSTLSFEVKEFIKTPNFKAKEFLRVSYI